MAQFVMDSCSVNEKGHLSIAGNDTVDLAKQYGTPLMVFDEDKIRKVLEIYDRNAIKAKTLSCVEEYYTSAKMYLADLDVPAERKKVLYDYAEYLYKTNGTCSREIAFEIENGKVKNVQFFGGCNGNLQGIAALVKGMSAKEAVSRLKGIRCGFRATSCPDQLATALEKLNTLKPAALNSATTLLILSDTKTIDLNRAAQALLEVKRQTGKVIWLNPIPESKWGYLKSVQVFSTLCTMVSCSTLHDLAAACKKLADS